MKTYEGVEIELHALLTSTLGKGDFSGSCPEHFGHGETNTSVHLIGCVGPRTGLDAVEKRKTCGPAGNETFVPQSTSVYPNRNGNRGTERRIFLLCDTSL